MKDEFISKQDAITEICDCICGELKDTCKSQEDCSYYNALKLLPAANVVPVNREKLMAVLRDYFSIGDSYTYELTRVKSAFDIGTMSLDDFKEWEEEDISCLCDYILRELRMGNKDG